MLIASGPLRLWIELFCSGNQSSEGTRAAPHRLMPDDLALQVSRQGSRKVTVGRSEAEESARSLRRFDLRDVVVKWLSAGRHTTLRNRRSG